VLTDMDYENHEGLDMGGWRYDLILRIVRYEKVGWLAMSIYEVYASDGFIKVEGIRVAAFWELIGSLFDTPSWNQAFRMIFQPLD